MLAHWKERRDKPRQRVKKQRHHFAHKGPFNQSYGFPSTHVWMWELDHKEAQCQRTDAFKLWCWRKLLRAPWTARRSNKSILGNQPSTFIGRTDAEAPLLWPPDAKSRLNGKDPDAGKDWGQQEKGVTKDEMVGWHHWFNGQEFEQTLGDSERQGSLPCCSPWGHKESGTTEQLPNNNNKISFGLLVNVFNGLSKDWTMK